MEVAETFSATSALSGRLDDLTHPPIYLLRDLLIRVFEHLTGVLKADNFACGFWPDISKLKCPDATGEIDVAVFFGLHRYRQARAVDAIP